MPVETATYINQLVSSNPTHTDGLNQMDSHIRLVKSALLATFPNIAGAVTATDVDLSGVSGLVNNGVLTVAKPSTGTTTGGSIVLKGAGSNPDITLSNVSGGLSINIGTLHVAGLSGAGNLSLLGNANAVLMQESGNTLLPAGCIIQWTGSIAAIPAGWHLCDGTSGTPDLRDKFLVGAGNSYVVAQTGGATSTTPTTAAAGFHTHTGATGYAGGHTHTATTDSQGAHSHFGATAGHALSLSEMPYHDHGLGGVDMCVLTSGGVGFSGGGLANGINFSGQGANSAHTHNIATDGSHAHNVTVVSVSDHYHTISSDGTHTHAVTVATVPPYYALAFIMKL